MKVLQAFFSACAVLFLFSCAREPSFSGHSVAGYDNKWTTVVYMAADNDLEAAALDDFREMVSGAGGLTEAGHTVLVLLDRASGYDASEGDWTDSRLFKLSPSEDFSLMQISCSRLGLSVTSQTELNMAASETLKNVLLFAQEEYSAANYALIVWGHGSGWRGYAIDDDSDGVMSLPAMHAAVSCLEKPLSVIAFDCCYGAMLETAYELRNDAQFLVAAERDEPAAGWNYAFFLQNLTQDTDNADAAGWYARCAVDAFAREYADLRGTSITALRLSEVEDVFTEFDSFSGARAAVITTREAALSFSEGVLTQAAFLSGEYPAYRFADVDSIAACFPQAEALRNALKRATLVSFTGGSGAEAGMSGRPLLAVYVATIRSGGVVEADYPQLYVRGNGVAGQCAFVRDSTGWVPQQTVSQSTSLLDHLYRMPLP